MLPPLPAMLDLDANRQGPTPRDASTLVVARDARSGGGIEIFCVERQKAGFLGGAVVFPGGKLDASDLDAAWESCVTPPPATGAPVAVDITALRGLAIAACREALEEAAILPVTGGAPTHADLLAWRAEMARGTGVLRTILASRGLRLDLASLHPLARWVTPVAEARRFDTRFFLFVSAGDTTGAHDDYETTASFWASPADVLARYAAGALVLAPPTHRMLQVLSAARDTADAVAIASRACLDPICPRVVTQHDVAGDTVAIVLPGDPEHDIPVARVPGPSRYVLRNGRFWPENAPG
jgi:8-oxo-dGTP pyrophosphatase MutT (NUDIX family)